MSDLAAHDIARVRADNPSPYTLDGTNTWVIGRDPAWVVDPGPALDQHLEAIAREVERRGGAGGIALTHDHPDHAEGVEALRERIGAVPVAAARYDGDVALADGDEFGPLRALAIPGHADDHLAFVSAGAGFTGDSVLGHGSVFVTGRLREYLEALERLRALDLDVLCPGHGPPVAEPGAKLTEYIEHRLEREQKLLAALDNGLRGRDELLDAAWSDAPAALRGAAGMTLDAHLDKLREEGRLPAGIQ